MNRNCLPREPVTYVLDVDSGRAGILLAGGQHLSVPLHDSQSDANESLVRVVHVAGSGEVLFETKQGDRIVAELPSLTERPDRRVSVYLDQKDWRTLRDAQYEPNLVASDAEREAANELVRFVLAGKVVLPFSSAHLLETASWGDQRRRYELGVTILRLSRGWQVRDPLAVREGELRAALTHRGQSSNLAVPNVVTLEPNAVHSGRSLPSSVSFNLPPALDFLAQALTSATVYFSTMLDEERLRPEPVPGWVHAQQQVSASIAADRPPRAAADAQVDEFFVRDTAYELTRAARATGTSRSQLDAWLQHGAGRDVPLMPSLGLFRDVLRERHLNATGRWKESDLIDLMYLTVAAGYADHVVGERHFTTHLKRAASRLGSEISVHRHLRDLIPSLTAQLQSEEMRPIP